MAKPKKPETATTPAPLPFSPASAPPTAPAAPVPEAPAWVETILAEVRSGTERLKGTLETQAARSGEAAALTEILQRLEAVAGATRVTSTSADITTLRGELRSALAEIRSALAEMRRISDLTLSAAQSADKYAAEVEGRTRPVAEPEPASVEEAPRLGIIGFLRAMLRPEVQVGMGRLVRAAERMGTQNRLLLPGDKPVLSLPDKTD